MKVLTNNFKDTVHITTENQDDLWVLNQIIEPGDKIKGKTQRKIKLEGGSERTTNVIRKWVSMEITTEKIAYTAHQLRITGPIINGPEDIARGSYHTFAIEDDSTFSITKKQWLSYQQKQLIDATKAQPPTILITIFDREDALFAINTKTGYKLLTTLSGNVPKKEERAQSSGNFYQEIIRQVEEYCTRHNPAHIVLASPSFWKDELMKHWKSQELRKILVFATCSTITETAITEVLKRQEVQTVLKQDRIAQETIAVEKVFQAIAKHNKVCYGKKETKVAADAGAVELLIVTDSRIQESREDDSYPEFETILKSVDQSKGKIMIIASQHDAGKRLNGLGGIAGLLRYSLS